MPLHIEHRPQDLSEIYGNKAVKESLESIFSRKEDYPHSYLLHGPTGCGKTTLARILAKMLDCSNPEEFNMSNTRGIDTIRDVNEMCQYFPLHGTKRVYIFDEIHRQTKDAQNALLKLLEEPPSHVYFILCTTEPEQLLPTIRGRCHTYHMKTLNSTDMMTFLKDTLEKEGLSDYPKAILTEIAVLSDGHVRNALVMLDTIIDMEDEESALKALSSISTLEATSKDLCQMIVQGGEWEKGRKILTALLADNEPEKLRQAVLGYLTNTLLGSKRNDRVSMLIDIFSETIFYNPRAGIVNMVYVALTRK